MKKSRPLFIFGNWKLNHTQAETGIFFDALSKEAAFRYLFQNLRVGLYPSFLSLERAVESVKLKKLHIEIGAQNASAETKGAFTGEVSGEMLKEIGITRVLVGHSERRKIFGETDVQISKKCDSLTAQGFQVMLCVGETKEEREAVETESVVRTQLDGALSFATAAAQFEKNKIEIAYEPVWAIGTGLTATPEQAEAVHAFIRNWFQEKFGEAIAQKTPLLYGGSVTEANAAELLSCANIDGALIGGASLKPASFAKIIEIANTCV